MHLLTHVCTHMHIIFHTHRLRYTHETSTCTPIRVHNNHRHALTLCAFSTRTLHKCTHEHSQSLYIHVCVCIQVLPHAHTRGRYTPMYLHSAYACILTCIHCIPSHVHSVSLQCAYVTLTCTQSCTLDHHMLIQHLSHSCTYTLTCEPATLQNVVT